MSNPYERIFSQNETYDLGLKAVRGARLEWGIAEEGGYALQWLCVRGIKQGAEALATLLDTIAEARWTDFCPILAPAPAPASASAASKNWTAPNGTLCPLALGICLGDSQPQNVTDIQKLDITLDSPLYFPILLAPFLAQIATRTQTALGFTSEGNSLCVTPEGTLFAKEGILMCQSAPKGRIHACSPSPSLAPYSPQSVCPIAQKNLIRLKSYADRTLVPASAESRTGAGAALSDND